MNYKEVFNALPHINKIWVQKNGEFHLDDTKGGELVEREDLDDNDNDNDKKSVKEMQELIEICSTAEEVDEVVGNDTRKGVLKAAEAKKSSLKN